MSSSREGINPLRPYYTPRPSGLTPDPLFSATSAGLDKPSRSIPLPSASSAKASLSSSAREIFSDLDYSEYLSDASPSASEVSKRLLDQAIWRYTSVLIAQPFEVAKTILQVHLATSRHLAQTSARSPSPSRYQGVNEQRYDDEYNSSNSDSDVPSYFTSNAPKTTIPSVRQHSRRTRAQRRSQSSSSLSPATNPSSRRPFSQRPKSLTIQNPSSLFEALSQVWTKEGAFGIWKGANTTFVYSVLLKTIESWTRSLLAAVLDVPDPGLLNGGIDVLESPFPLATIGIVVAASGIAGLLLAPLDMIRTQLILTPTSDSPRSLLASLRSLPSLICPPSILPVTVLHATLSPLLTVSTPLILRSRLAIDPLLTPTASSVLTFFSSTLELGLRLPLETVLRRGQIAAVQASRDLRPAGASRSGHPTIMQLDTVVQIGGYSGVIGTMWNIVHYEGTSLTTSSAPAAPMSSSSAAAEAATSSAKGRGKTTSKRERKGQGVEGLFRGWRVGLWGLIGMYGAAAMGGVGGKGGEF